MRNSLLLAGACLLISGTLLLGMVYFVIANYAPNMTGWSGGKFSAALDQTLLKTPLIISILFMIVGVILFALVIHGELTNKNLETKNIN